MSTTRITTGDVVVASAAAALVIDLLLLPWHQVFSSSRTAVQAPGGWLGTLAVILTLAIIGLTAVRRFTTVTLPTLPRPIGEVTLAAASAVFALLAVKLALDPSYLGFGSYLGLILAAAMVAGAIPGRSETDEPPPVGSGHGTPQPF